jgi:aspartyl-tRNA(Asn)/glutamyl-tRNA(Gln) amidotransferase subunit A
VPLSAYLDTPGFLARTVDDATFVATAIDRRIGAMPDHIGGCTLGSPLRIGIPEGLMWDDCEPGIAEGVRASLAKLERAGHRLVPIRYPEADKAFEVFKAGGTAGAELLAFLRAELPEWIPQLDPYTAARMNAAAEITAVEFLSRQRTLDTLSRQSRRHFSEVDVIASPTTPASPPPLAELVTWDQARPRNLKMLRNTSIGNLLQLCALTLPVGSDALGMPVGLQLMADHGRDDLLFAAGLEIERVLGAGA